MGKYIFIEERKSDVNSFITSDFNELVSRMCRYESDGLLFSYHDGNDCFINKVHKGVINPIGKVSKWIFAGLLKGLSDAAEYHKIEETANKITEYLKEGDD